MVRVFAVLVVACLAASQARAAPPPRAPIASFAELKTPLPYPYDETVAADEAVDKARVRAKAHHRRLLIDLGGNWCGDCRILAATMDLPSLRAFIAKHYEVVTVDVGRFDRNLQVPARYGLTQRLKGVPTLLVVDPKTDALLNPDDVFALSSAGDMTPQALADWFGRWAR